MTEPWQRGQCRPAAFIGVRRRVGTTTLAVNVAAILGIVARRRTLLLDLSGNDSGVSEHLRISSGRNLLNLTTPFLNAGTITVEDLAEQVVRYEPGQPWPTGVSALDIIPGFSRDQLTPVEADKVPTYRKAQLVSAVCQAANQAGYQFVLLENGAWQKDLPRDAILINSDPVVLVGTDERADVERLVIASKSLEDIGHTALTAINGTTTLSFRNKYSEEHSWLSREPVLETLAYRAVPLAKGKYGSRYEEQGVPMALHTLEHARLKLDPFAAALIALARHIDPQVDDNLLDSEGKPVRKQLLEALGDLLVD